MWLRRLLRFIAYSSLALLIAGLFSWLIIMDSSAPYLFSDLRELPVCKAGLVLGTSKNTQHGKSNPYFSTRMNAAAWLFRCGLVEKLIVSGDNRVNDYNEPKLMKQALIELGVPDSCIVLDYAGLRTLDSMVRCREVFGQDSVIVVSQEFHNARAVFIGRRKGLAAFGYNAAPVYTSGAVKTSVREFFSRMKCLLDLFVLNTRPRHLGPKIKI